MEALDVVDGTLAPKQPPLHRAPIEWDQTMEDAMREVMFSSIPPPRGGTNVN